MRLERDQAVLLVIDVQEKFVPVIHDYPNVLDNITRAIRGAQILQLPILLTEQYPKGLGRTVAEIRDILQPCDPLEKISFSCCGEQAFMSRLKALKRRQLLVCGIETHVCVYQTCRDLLEGGYDVHLLGDCVSSRTLENRNLAINKLRSLGVQISGVEMALFELLRVAGSGEFKMISKIVK